jgi:hypothetical protein
MVTKVTRFYFGLANEVGAGVKTKKLRVVLVKETTLRQIVEMSARSQSEFEDVTAGGDARVVLKKEYYGPRLRTLKAMAELYAEGSKALRDIDLCIPINNGRAGGSAEGVMPAIMMMS